MPDEHLPPVDDDEAGSDWEDAFQAEEYMLSPEEQAGSTLMAERDRQAAPAAAPQAVESPQPSILARIGDLSFPWKFIPGPVGGRIGQWPAERRGLLTVAVGAVTVLFVVLALVVAAGDRSRPEEQVAGGSPAPEQPAPEQPSPQTTKMTAPLATGGQSVSVGPPTFAGEPDGGRQAVAVEAARPLDLPPPVTTVPDLERRKWRFASFMIGVDGGDGSGGLRYVAVDLSLILRLEPGDELPADRQYAIRDFIYQFYANRPFYELKRYSLARGEMNRNLLAWLRRQWPNAPVETIVFHRYRIL